MKFEKNPLSVSKQLLTKTLIVSWISPREYSMIDCFLGDAFGVTLCPARFGVLFCSVLPCGVEYCSVSWCIFLIHNNVYISRNTFSWQSVNSDINIRLLRHLLLIWLIMEKESLSKMHFFKIPVVSLLKILIPQPIDFSILLEVIYKWNITTFRELFVWNCVISL